MADRETKERIATLTGIGQRMVNQENPLSKIKEVILSRMIEESENVLNVIKKDISKGTV